MNLASTWALVGLLLLAPLVLLHLRGPRRAVQEVPSLLLWLQLQQPQPQSRVGRRLLPTLPLLLLAQALALVLLVLSLAQPSARTRAHQVAASSRAGETIAAPLPGCAQASGPDCQTPQSLTSRHTTAIVTLVGEPSDAQPLARALSVLPHVRLRLRTPSSYRPGDARESSLVVLNRWVPAGGLPDVPGVLLIDPPRVPGGHVRGSLRESTLSGTAPSSPLLEGVDLGALAIEAGGAESISLPHALQWAAWSPEGPLLASGRIAGRQIAVLSFDPSRSDLPQLSAFPALVSNLVGWLTAPVASAPPVHGSAQARHAALPAAPAAGIAPWLLALALLVLLLEGLYGVRLRAQERLT